MLIGVDGCSCSRPKAALPERNVKLPERVSEEKKNAYLFIYVLEENSRYVIVGLVGSRGSSFHRHLRYKLT